MENLQTVDTSNFTAAEEREYNLQTSNILRLNTQLDILKQTESNKPLTYVKERAKKSLKFHSDKLESLEDDYSRKLKELEEYYKTEKERLEKERERQRDIHTEAIEEAGQKLDAKSSDIIRCELLLSQAIEKRNKWFTQSSPITQSAVPVVKVQNPEKQKLIERILADNPKAEVGEWNDIEELRYQASRIIKRPKMVNRSSN